MNLLECQVGLALGLILVSPILKTSSAIIAKQLEYEKVQALSVEADRALELIGRAMRMAGYQNSTTYSEGIAERIKEGKKEESKKKESKKVSDWIEILKGQGLHGSDSIFVRHELSDGIDLDCLGNTLTIERTENHLAYQGFLVGRQAFAQKGSKIDRGSLICQSLDRHGRLQNIPLMDGVQHLSVQELPVVSGLQRILRVKLRMADGHLLEREFERTFATRNLL